MSNKYDCVLRSEFRTLGWEICRRTGLTFDDIYIYWHNIVGEHVVMLEGEFCNYAEDFWQQGNIYSKYKLPRPVQNVYKKQEKRDAKV